jgi:hypothetical protein
MFGFPAVVDTIHAEALTWLLIESYSLVLVKFLKARDLRKGG